MHALIVAGAIGLDQSRMVHFAHSGCPCGRRDGEAPSPAAYFESTFPKFLSSPTLGPFRLQSPYPNANLSNYRTPRLTPPQPKLRRVGRLDSEPEPPNNLLPPSCPCDSTTSRRGTIVLLSRRSLLRPCGLLVAGRCRSWRANGGNLEVLTPLAGPVYGEHTSLAYPNVKNPYNYVTVQIITVDAKGVQDTKVITDKLQYLPDCGCDDDCTPYTGFVADPRNCPSPTVATSFSSAAADNCCQRTPAGQPEYFRCNSARPTALHECIQTSRQTHV